MSAPTENVGRKAKCATVISDSLIIAAFFVNCNMGLFEIVFELTMILS